MCAWFSPRTAILAKFAPETLITGIVEAEQEGAIVFQAGTRQATEGVVTSGGRVLGVTSSGPDLQTAIDKHIPSGANTFISKACISEKTLARKG